MINTNRHKPLIVTSIIAFSVISLSVLSVIIYSNKNEQILAQTLPTNVNVTDLDDSQVNAYYSGVSGKSGDQLVSALNTIIDDHREYNYESTTDRYAYKIMDRNWTLSPLTPAQLANFSHANDMPYIRKLYGNYNDSVQTADLFYNVGASRVSFDKEHIWAQSMGDFGRTSGAGADFHMLLPGDVVGNQGMHSNYNFATPTSSITQYYGDPTQTTSSWTQASAYVGRNGYISGYTQKVCEPRDEYKGDIARAMFYMPARYYTYEDEFHPKLVLVNGSPSAVTASSSQPGLAGDLATLLLWNESDPVDEYEIHRNNLIYNNYQLNRNPFIDHPEWARIAYDTSYSGSGASTAAGSSSVGTQQGTLIENITLDKSSHTMEVNDVLTLTPTISPSNAENKVLSWSSTNQSVATVSNGVVTAHALGTTTITATATDGSGKSATCTIEVATVVVNLDYIEVSGASETATFGSTYSTDSIVVTAHYDNSSTQDVTVSSTINTPNTSVLGEQSINVSYQDKTAYYQVTVTNHNANISSEDVGLEYASVDAASGAIAGWTGYGLGAAYADGSVKLDGAGDYLYKTDIWSGTSSQKISSIDITIKIRQNGGTAYLTANELQVICLNGTLATEVGSINQVGGFSASTEEEYLTITLSSPSTITGLKILYKTKVTGNLGIYFVKATPTYTLNLDVLQAEAWADYFLLQTSESCNALEAQSSSVWTILGNEYGWMHADSKAHFTTATPSEKVQSAIDRYNAIISAHAENIPFITGLPGASSSLAIDKANNNNLIVFLTLTASSIAFFFYFTKKKRIID